MTLSHSRQTDHRRRLLQIGAYRGAVPSMFVMIAFVTLLHFVSPTGFTQADLNYTASGGATLALAAIGQTVVVLVGGFDLSSGAIISLVNVILATNLEPGAASSVTWVIAGILIGTALGATNGFVVAYLRVQPVVATLSMMFVTQGLALLVLDKPGGSVPEAFSGFFLGSTFGENVPTPLVIVVLSLVLWTLLKNTRFGTSLYALGSDSDAAHQRGINVPLVKFAAYTLAGTAYGAAGVFITAQTASGDPLIGAPLLLQVFAAVVIGGTRLGGGRGGCVGSAIGAYVLILIVNVLLVFNFSSYFGTIAEGVILVIAALGHSSSDLPRANWSSLFAIWSARRRPAKVPEVAVIPHVAEVYQLPGVLRRNVDVFRYTLPAFACLGIVIALQASLYGHVGVPYFNSLITLASFLIILALGQGTVILTGGLDLSLPWTICLSGLLFTDWTQGDAASAIWAVPIVLIIGTSIGALNGLGVVALRLPAIVVTLAMNGILQGLALLYCNGTPSGMSPEIFHWLMTGRLLGFSPISWLLIIFVVFGVLLLGQTTFGRRIYAVGNSVRVARLAGVKVGATIIAAYSLSGACSALVGILLAGFIGQASLGMGDEFLLSSIAAIVVGGTLITGARGKYLGMIGGVLLLTALQTFLASSLLPEATRQIVFGAVMLAAVVSLREG